MPIFAVSIHVFLLAASLLIGARASPKRGGAIVLTAVVVAIVSSGFVVERSAYWSWIVAGFAGPDAVFFTNISAQGAALFSVILWRKANSSSSKVRASILGALLLSSSALSYAWYFRPLPAGLSGHVNRRGFCRQTTRDSCSAAAAVTLLSHEGIQTDEAEMANLCLTRERFGTTPLGLYRGLSVKAHERGFVVRVVYCPTVTDLASRALPSIINVGISRDTPEELVAKMESFGWPRGVNHAVTVIDADPNGEWIDVADPSSGLERWPAEHLLPIWGHFVLALERAK